MVWGWGSVLGKGAVIHTTLGDITIRLYPDECPKTVENFCTHAKNNYYNGIIFHRVIKAFMLQTGLSALFFDPSPLSLLFVPPLSPVLCGRGPASPPYAVCVCVCVCVYVSVCAWVCVCVRT